MQHHNGRKYRPRPQRQQPQLPVPIPARPEKAVQTIVSPVQAADMQQYVRKTLFSQQLFVLESLWLDISETAFLVLLVFRISALKEIHL